MTKQELVKSSSIWNSDENTKVESVDTYLGVFNEELWDMIFDEVDNEWVLVEKEVGKKVSIFCEDICFVSANLFTRVLLAGTALLYG